MSFGADWTCSCGWANLDVRPKCRNCGTANPEYEPSANKARANPTPGGEVFESDKTRAAVGPVRAMLDEGINIQATGDVTNAVIQGALQACISHIDELEADFAALRTAVALAKPAPAVDDRMFWYLRVLDASGGFAQSSGDPGEWVAAFCDDREPTDTYNLAEEQGYTITSHDSRFDSSVVRLTDKGKSALAALALAAQAGAQEGER